jgi:NAD(P)-dependent dehydrogenase (short-subunit alcohol dehydrogenase family)
MQIRERGPMSRAFVTGGASGIGAATARRLAADGWTVTVADVQDDLGAGVAGEIGGDYVHLDVGDASAWDGLLDGVDLVHLNAGVVTGAPSLAELTDEQYRRIMGVNVDGVVFGLREAFRSMPDGANVVATASVAGLMAFALDPIYTLTKHAVVGLVRAAAFGRLRVNAVCPGIVETPLVGAEAMEMLKQAKFPFIDPAQVADAVVAAASSGRSGECWTVLPGRDNEPFTFAEVVLPPIG